MASNEAPPVRRECPPNNKEPLVSRSFPPESSTREKIVLTAANRLTSWPLASGNSGRRSGATLRAFAKCMTRSRCLIKEATGQMPFRASMEHVQSSVRVTPTARQSVLLDGNSHVIDDWSSGIVTCPARAAVSSTSRSRKKVPAGAKLDSEVCDSGVHYSETLPVVGWCPRGGLEAAPTLFTLGD